MKTSYQDTAVDRYQFDPRRVPDYRVVLYSRNLDSDSDIVNNTATQTPIDLTKYVTRMELSLSSDTTASTASIEVVITSSIPVDLFYNAAVKVFEGDSRVASESWPQTFFGFHVGQPQATEMNHGEGRALGASSTQRGNMRTTNVTFVSRAAMYATDTIITPGVWLPNGSAKNPNGSYSYRDDYDDVGLISAEIASQPWGMGLSASEVTLGTAGYRIMKQLQIVQESPLAAVKTLLDTAHLEPYFDGDGRLRAFSKVVTKNPVREYDTDHIIAVTQTARQGQLTSAVRVTGLSSELSEVIHADQELADIQGTFGFFDPSMEFTGTWSSDDTESFRVKNATVVDGVGATVVSPRIENFQQDGFILQPVGFPTFEDGTSEYRYQISISNDVFLVVAAIAALIGGYAAAVIVSTTSPEISSAPGTPDVPNPAAIAADLVASALLIAGVSVLQQIGNFQFKVYGVPYETVYQELSHEATLVQFAGLDSDNSTLRGYERRVENVENYILSTSDDVTTDNGSVNEGLKSWAENRLAFEVAKNAQRTIEMIPDSLLEPGDVVTVDGQKIFVEAISRSLSRSEAPRQTVVGFQIGVS